MSFSDGYNEIEIDAPKFVSRGEWDMTGNVSSHMLMPIKPVTTLTTGGFGVSGTYETYNWCLPYNDNSGISGCIGILLRTVKSVNDTGFGYSTNENIGLRKVLIMHEGYAPMYYQSGTLDGTPRKMKYGDLIAPCQSGFRTWEHINFTGVSGSQGFNLVTVLHTGYQQVKLGWWADVASQLTGNRFRVKVMPNTIFGSSK